MSILGLGANAIASDSLLTSNPESVRNTMEYIALTQIIPGNYQPRKNKGINEEILQELVESIREQGILQPVLLRRKNKGYELIAGERRYHSAKIAGLSKIPSVVLEVSESEAFAIALVENIQREQLSLLEEAEACLKLKETWLLTVEEVSKRIGKPRTTVANLIRVALHLSEKGKQFWEEKKVDYGHIRAIITLNHDYQNKMLDYIVEKKLSVRSTEKVVKNKEYDDWVKAMDCNIKQGNILKSKEKEILMEKFYRIYNKKVKINAVKGDKIRISLEFDTLNHLYDYLNQ